MIRQDEKILLVYQSRAGDPYPTWALPGGRLEHGESLAHGLVREVREETGLIVDRIGKLISVTHLVDRPQALQAVSFVFEVGEWSGVVARADPDELVLKAVFLSVADAVARLEKSVWPAMFEPVAAYLLGTHAAGTVWLYSEHNSEQRLLATLPEKVAG